MAMSLRFRSAALVRAYVASWLLLGWVAAAEARTSPRIPFDSALVTAKGPAFELEWQAPTAHRVQIYAGTDPRHVGRSHLVATGPGIGRAQVDHLPDAARWYFEFVPDVGEPLTLADRSLHLASASNFRDVGGYRTRDGHWVRMGVAYRSNGLGALTPADYERLGELGIRLVCDLRRDEERRRQPDPTLPHSQAVVADVAADSGDIQHNTATLAALMRAGDPASAIEYVKSVYRGFVSLSSARGGYHLLFERLANHEDLPTVFHCTAGKDRTGWAQAVLLALLGVPRETIVQDYELTDRYLSDAALEQIRRSMPDADPAAWRVILAANPTYLDAAFTEVSRRYGSFDAYLHDGLGLDARTVQAIRHNFLGR
jgi:protein-tyrosine phosphatase